MGSFALVLWPRIRCGCRWLMVPVTLASNACGISMASCGRAAKGLAWPVWWPLVSGNVVGERPVAAGPVQRHRVDGWLAGPQPKSLGGK